MVNLRELWLRARFPEKSFRLLASEELSLWDSLGRLLLWRAPVALAEGILTYWSFARLYRSLASGSGPLWEALFRALPPEFSAEEVRGALQGLPELPVLARALPWLSVAAPLYVLSLWLHDAVWDHGCLWMLGGLRGGKGFRVSLIAESEALQAGVLGAALGLLTSLPGLGWLLSLPVALVAAYFWILRGVALAAFHGCPVWKGIVATLLHALLIACLAGAFLLLCVLAVAGLLS